jgi:hypothetical protein
MTIESRIYAFIQPLAGCFCVWGQQNSPAPPKPYLSIRDVSTMSSEHENYDTVDSTGAQIVSSTRDITIELQIYGEGAYDMLEALRQKVLWQTSLDIAEQAGIAVFHRANVMNIATILDTASWEPRAMLELGFRYVLASVDQVGLIETVNATGRYSGDLTDTLDVTFHIVDPTPDP